MVTRVKSLVRELRDAAEKYPNAAVWKTTDVEIADGDLILQAGNTGGASWIEISKSPFDAGGSTVLETREYLDSPLRIVSGLTMSQRAAGQHIGSMELVSTDDWDGAVPIPDPVPVPILNASQATTTITINFAAAPQVPFRIGQRVNVYGFVESRLNVASATIASVPSATQVTIVGNAYTFASTTISSQNGNGLAFIERIDVLGGARNGVAVLHESGTVTQCSVYSRSEGGLGRPSGTLAGSHQITTGTDAATQLTTAPASQAFTPGVQTRLDLSPDGFLLSDRATGASGIFASRYRHDEVVPNPVRPYKLRYRLRSAKAVCRPIAEILSATKAGSTTATFVTKTPHGLVTGQYIGHYGVGNQTNFAAQTTGVAVTVVNATTFTCVTGISATSTSYGGFIWIAEGQQALPGAVAQAAVSVTRVANIVTLTGSAAWSGPAIGELVEVYGVSNVVDGANLGIDGTYRVDNVATTTLTLSPVEGTPTGGDIGATTIGGGVIRRTELRIHYTVAQDFGALLVESVSQGIGDQANALPISVNGGTLTALGTVTTLTGITNALPAGTNAVGDVGQQYRANATGAGSVGKVLAAANTNPTVVKAAAGRLLGFDLANTTANWRYVKFHNIATAPTAGSTAVVFAIGIPPNGKASRSFEGGFGFATGIAYTIVTGAADADATAVSANDVIGALLFA